MVSILISLDTLIASIVYVIAIYFFLSNSTMLGDTMVSDYNDSWTALRLFQISEILVTGSNKTEGGLAFKYENTVQHHRLKDENIKYLGENIEQIKTNYWGFNQSLGILLISKNRNLTLGNLTEGFKITRYALCEEGVCRIELYG